MMSAPMRSTSSTTVDKGIKEGKHRASQACSACRSRKVRCDMLESGLPCTRCRIDRFDCVAEPRKKRGKRPGQATKGTATPASASGANPSNSADEMEASPASLRAFPRHSILHRVPFSPFLLEFSDVKLDRDSEEQCVESNARNHGRSRAGYGAFHVHSEDDLLFLRRKGAFDLPQRLIMDQFIVCYFKIFHPFLPVIDKEIFLRNYQRMKDSTQQCLSLLLLQAVLFVASSYVAPELLAECGFPSRKKAREVIHKRATHLYNFDCETNDVVNIQALLLLSHHYSSMTDQKHTWHWVYQAISLAQGAGLHRDPGDIPQRRLWARIWWACLVRDRLVSLGTNRPMHINSLDCTVRMLTPQDLEECGDTHENRATKAVFLEFVKLCQYMEGVLSLQHTSTVTGKILSDQVRVCENTLQHWLNNLAPEAKRQEDRIIHLEQADIASLYRIVLHLIYNTVTIALNQCSVSDGIELSSSRMNRQEKIQLAASDSTQLVAQLVNFDLVKYCPTMCVTAALPPLIIHTLGIRASSSLSLKEIHMNRYDMCMMFLQQLGDIYWHASIYHDFFELALSVRHATSPSVSATGDPLVAFLQRQMMSRNNGILGEDEACLEDLDCNQNAPKDNIELFAAEQRRAGQAPGDESADSSRLISTRQATPEMNHTFSTPREVQFEEWLDFGGGFHSIFPAA